PRSKPPPTSVSPALQRLMAPPRLSLKVSVGVGGRLSALARCVTTAPVAPRRHSTSTVSVVVAKALTWTLAWVTAPPFVGWGGASETVHVLALEICAAMTRALCGTSHPPPSAISPCGQLTESWLV